jgi:hypothetical protein
MGAGPSVGIAVGVDVGGGGVSLAGTGVPVGVKVDPGGRGASVGAEKGVLVGAGFSVGGTVVGVEPQPTRTINRITNSAIYSGYFITKQSAPIREDQSSNS